MKKFFLTMALAITFSACSNSKDDAVTYDITADVTEKPQPKPAATPAKRASRLTESDADKGSEPYKLGREHAKKLHSECTTTDAVRDELLDINARITNIQCRISQDAANDYMHGLKDYLTEVGDTLATTLF